MEYTKGKWERNRFTIECDDKEIAHLPAPLLAFRKPELDGNANLIAAAPDMYGVVKQFVRYCDQWQRAHGDFDNGDGRSLILGNALASLAKAEGKGQ